MIHLTDSALREEILNAERELDQVGVRERRMWDRVSVDPEKWVEGHYGNIGPVWVVAVMGRRCLYFNPVEGGWGWGTFDTWGVINGYHWQADEIQHSIFQALFAIDHGGAG